MRSDIGIMDPKNELMDLMDPFIYSKKYFKDAVHLIAFGSSVATGS